MDIVEQVARMIDPEPFEMFELRSAIKEGYGDTLDAARSRLQKAAALHVASEILKLALKQSNLRQQLIDFEADGWRKLGVPIDEPLLRETLEQKYGHQENN